VDLSSITPTTLRSAAAAKSNPAVTNSATKIRGPSAAHPDRDRGQAPAGVKVTHFAAFEGRGGGAAGAQASSRANLEGGEEGEHRLASSRPGFPMSMEIVATSRHECRRRRPTNEITVEEGNATRAAHVRARDHDRPARPLRSASKTSR